MGCLSSILLYSIGNNIPHHTAYLHTTLLQACCVSAVGRPAYLTPVQREPPAVVGSAGVLQEGWSREEYVSEVGTAVLQVLQYRVFVCCAYMHDTKDLLH